MSSPSGREVDMDLGILILRVVLGLLFMGHGAQKLFGWFGGYGVAGTAGWLESLGFRAGKPMALAAGLSELGGGLLIALGLLSPLGAAAVIGMMITAIATVHLGKGPWAASGGWELNATNIAAAAVVGFAGPGRYSLDKLAGWDLSGLEWGAAAVTGAAVTSLLTLATRRRQVPVEAVATQSQAA